MRSAHRQAMLVVALVAIACAVPTAALASSSRAAARDSGFCGVAKSFALSLQKAPTTQSLVASEAQLKTNLTRLDAAKGSLEGAAPGSLKGDVTTIIGLYGMLRVDLSKVNWNLATLAKNPLTMGTLLADAKKDKPAFTHLKAYLDNTCKFT